MNGKIIAISAISSALSIILLTLGHYVSILDLSCLMFASIVIMLPLYKKSIKGAIFSFFSTLILTCFLTGFKLNIIIPYALFFGLHPIFNEIQINKNFNKWICFIIKLIWFILSLFVMYFTTNMFVDINEKAEKYFYIAIPIVGILFFILYDILFLRLRKRLDILLKNIGL